MRYVYSSFMRESRESLFENPRRHIRRTSLEVYHSSLLGIRASLQHCARVRFLLPHMYPNHMRLGTRFISFAARGWQDKWNAARPRGANERARCPASSCNLPGPGQKPLAPGLNFVQQQVCPGCLQLRASRLARGQWQISGRRIMTFQWRTANVSNVVDDRNETRPAATSR